MQLSPVIVHCVRKMCAPTALSIAVLFALLTLAIKPSAGLAAESELPPLQAIEQSLDLEKFAGDWHVVASIPVGIPFFDDSEAYNYTESYELLDDGAVKMTCEFNDGDYDGKRKRFSFTAEAGNKSNAEWDVQFLWPFKARYMVIHLDDDYQNVIVGVPSRRWAWVMSRAPDINEHEYASLIQILSNHGFDIDKVRRIPHATMLNGKLAAVK